MNDGKHILIAWLVWHLLSQEPTQEPTQELTLELTQELTQEPTQELTQELIQGFSRVLPHKISRSWIMLPIQLWMDSGMRERVPWAQVVTGIEPTVTHRQINKKIS